MLQLREGVDAVVPVLQGRPEPTHAVYSKACLPHMEQSLLSGQLKISGFYDQINVSYVSEDEIASLDPDFLSFFNVNTPDDLEKVLAWAEQGR
jgi:molybdopterin-guanine dinucleotide biosynthesis protein A